MLENSRSFLHRTALAMGWASSDNNGSSVPLSHTVGLIAETAIEGGYSAAISVGYCLPIKSPVTAAVGHGNLETGSPVERGSLFRIGACTRQFTAAAILLLAERNMLRLTDRVDRFVVSDPAIACASLRDLMTGDQATYALLGRIVEHVAATDFAEFVTDNLLLPAGMEASRFADATRIMPHRASGYRLTDERAHDFRNVDAGQGNPATDGLYTNAGDLMLWNRALHNGRLLTRDTVDLMTRAAAGGIPCPVLAPFAQRHARGLGLEVGRIFGRRAFWQRGQAPGFDAWLFHFPDDRTDLALLANTEHGAATVLEPILRAVLRL